MEIKCLIFDIDGTLVPKGQAEMEKSTKEALLLARKKGFKILVATGRSYYFVQKDVLDFKFDYYVTINGSCLLDQNGTILKTHEMKEEVIKKCIESAKIHHVGIAFKYKDHIRTATYHDYFVKNYLIMDDIDRIIKDYSKNFYDHLDELPLGCFAVGEAEEIAKVAAENPSLHFKKAAGIGYDVYDSSLGKTATIEDALSRMNLDWNHAMTFGDAGNDSAMLKKARIGVAMGQGNEEAKKAADYITTASNDDGIINALQHFELI